MKLEIRSSCPKVLLVHEQIKVCRGCRVNSENREGRQISRHWMQVYDKEWNKIEGVERAWVSVKDLGRDDRNEHLCKIHVYALHHPDDPNCYNYTIRSISVIREVVL